MKVTCIKDVFTDGINLSFIENKEYELLMSEYDGFLELYIIDELNNNHTVL